MIPDTTTNPSIFKTKFLLCHCSCNLSLKVRSNPIRKNAFIITDFGPKKDTLRFAKTIEIKKIRIDIIVSFLKTIQQNHCIVFPVHGKNRFHQQNLHLFLLPILILIMLSLCRCGAISAHL